MAVVYYKGNGISSLVSFEMSFESNANQNTNVKLNILRNYSSLVKAITFLGLTYQACQFDWCTNTPAIHIQSSVLECFPMNK